MLTPEGPQRDDLAPDIRAALDADPSAGSFFESLAQFYRNAYLRWIDGTKRRSEVHQAGHARVDDRVQDPLTVSSGMDDPLRAKLARSDPPPGRWITPARTPRSSEPAASARQLTTSGSARLSKHFGARSRAPAEL